MRGARRLLSAALALGVLSLAACSPSVQPTTPAPTNPAPPTIISATPVAAPTRGEISTPSASGGRILGRVTDVNGKPIVGARVVIPRGTSPVPEVAYLTNAQGEFTISVPPGQYVVSAFADGYPSVEKVVDTSGQGDVQVEFVLK